MSNSDQATSDLENVFPENDPGDEILRRFRYQVSYSAILAVIMVDGSEQIEEVFCEFHEDILVKHRDKRYTGIQVKTKDVNLPPFNLKDEAIFKAFTKFVTLESKYADQFINYSIVSNTGFDKSKPAVCINSMIEKAKKGEDLMRKGSKSAQFIKGIAKITGVDNNVIIETIKKS